MRGPRFAVAVALVVVSGCATSGPSHSVDGERRRVVAVTAAVLPPVVRKTHGDIALVSGDFISCGLTGRGYHYHVWASLAVSHDGPHVDELIEQQLRSHGMRVRHAYGSITGIRAGITVVIDQFVAYSEGVALDRSIVIDGPCLSFTKEQDDAIVLRLDPPLGKDITGKPGEVIGP